MFNAFLETKTSKKGVETKTYSWQRLTSPQARWDYCLSQCSFVELVLEQEHRIYRCVLICQIISIRWNPIDQRRRIKWMFCFDRVKFVSLIDVTIARIPFKNSCRFQSWFHFSLIIDKCDTIRQFDCFCSITDCQNLREMFDSIKPMEHIFFIEWSGFYFLDSPSQKRPKANKWKFFIVQKRTSHDDYFIEKNFNRSTTDPFRSTVRRHTAISSEIFFYWKLIKEQLNCELLKRSSLIKKFNKFIWWFRAVFLSRKNGSTFLLEQHVLNVVEIDANLSFWFCSSASPIKYCASLSFLR